MNWFSSRKPAKGAREQMDLSTGEHRSPGLAVLVAELEKKRAETILDLGVSSTENLRFLSRYADEVSLVDLARDGHSGEVVKARAEAAKPAAWVMPQEAIRELPAGGDARFDAVLIWDLLCYLRREDFGPFFDRILRHCRPGAILWLIASDRTPIPPTPIRFRIEGPETLFYKVDEAPRVDPPRLSAGGLERLLEDCETLRLFQLRNGLQEMLFRFRGRPRDGRPQPGGEGAESR